MSQSDLSNYDFARDPQGEVDEIACKLINGLCEPLGFNQARSGIWKSPDRKIQITLGLFGNTTTELRLFCSRDKEPTILPPLDQTYSELVVDLADEECQNKITSWLERVTS